MKRFVLLIFLRVAGSFCFWHCLYAKKSTIYRKVTERRAVIRETFNDVLMHWKEKNDTYETLIKLRRHYVPRRDGVEIDAVSEIVVRACENIERFNSQEKATLCWAVARLPTRKFVARAFFAKVAKELNCLDLDALRLATTVRAFALVGYFDNDKIFLDAAERTVASGAKDFNGIDCSHVAWGLTKYVSHKRHQIIIDEALRYIAQRASTLTNIEIAELATVAWALAKSSHRASFKSEACDALFHKLGQRVLTRLTVEAHVEPRAFDDVNIPFALARYLRDRHICMAPVVDALALRCTARINIFRSRELSQLAWSFASLRNNFDSISIKNELFTTFAQSAITGNNLDYFNTRELSQFAWALARACPPSKYRQDALLALAQVFIDRLNSIKLKQDFSTQALANVVWAMAKTETRIPKLFHQIALELEPRVFECNAQDLSNTVYAYAFVGFEAPALFEAIAAVAPLKIHHFKTQELANTAWAFATAYIVNLRRKKISTTSCHHCSSNTAHLLDAIAHESTPRLITFKPQELANLAWAFSKLEGYAFRKRSDFIAAISQSARINIKNLDPHHLTVLIYSFAKAGIADASFFADLAMEIRSKRHLFNEISKTQLRQAALFLRHRAPHISLPDFFDGTTTTLFSNNATTVHYYQQLQQRGRPPPPTQQQLAIDMRRFDYLKRKRDEAGKDKYSSSSSGRQSSERRLQ
uniref:RAP domain-containing protein n=1 Tax=Aureoumbra lagunensis TaxID=44058 RepID=A0A7S3JUB3_9STRA